MKPYWTYSKKNKTVSVVLAPNNKFQSNNNINFVLRIKVKPCNETERKMHHCVLKNWDKLKKCIKTLWILNDNAHDIQRTAAGDWSSSINSVNFNIIFTSGTGYFNFRFDAHLLKSGTLYLIIKLRNIIKLCISYISKAFSFQWIYRNM